MLKVTGQDPMTVDRRLRHHTEQYRPIVDALVYGIFLLFGQGEDIHRLHQSRNGMGSFALYPANGGRYHFRPGPVNTGAVRVLDSYTNGNEIALLDTPAKARNFIKRLAKQYRVAA
jgi:hypothetical protein